MEASTKDEQVNHPDHYTTGGLEVIDVIKAKLTPEEWKGYLKGNCLKYLLRADYKGQDVDIRKMMFYAERLVDCYLPTVDKSWPPLQTPEGSLHRPVFDEESAIWTANDQAGNWWRLVDDKWVRADNVDG